MQFVWDWFRWLYEATGINLTIFYDRFDRHRFADGFLTTIELSAACILLSVVIGVAGAWLQGSRLHALNAAFTLERFAQGAMIDEKGAGPYAWAH